MTFMDGKKPKDGTDLNGYIGAGTEVDGTLRFTDLFRVDGKLTGKIVSKNDLIVGEGGEVQAEIEVGNLSVSGTVSGKITIGDKLEIHSGGRVLGQLRMKAPKLIIEDGAVFEGEIDMGGAAKEGVPAQSDPLPEAATVKGFPSDGPRAPAES